MSHADILVAALSSAQGRLPVLHEMRALGRYGRPYLIRAPALLTLGLISRVAEAVVVGLTVLFLQAALGDALGQEQSSAVMQRVVEWVSATIGVGLLPLGAAIATCIAVRLLSDFALGIIDSRIFCNIGDMLRRDIYQQYLSADYAFISGHDQADLINVLENEAELVPEAFQTAAELIQEAMAVCIFGTMIVLVSWQLGILAAAGSGILLFLSHRLTRPIQELTAVSIARHRRMMRGIMVGLQGMKTIRAFAQEKAELRRFALTSRRLKSIHRRIDALQTLIDPVTELGQLILVAGLVLIGIRIDPSLTSTVTALALLYRLQPHASGLQSGLISLVAITPHLSVVRNVLEPGVETSPRWGSRPFKALEDGVRFEGVTMAYANAPTAALSDVTFDIPAGKISALLGPSGAGKSTVVNLLLGLYRPSGGEIALDGVPLSQFERVSWLRNVALAGQDVDVVEGTVASNIRLSRPQATLEEVRRAADIAGILPEIEALPAGFGNWIGERGAMVSGGQRQRIGLARAVLSDPRILILDEATSALDEPLERRIRDRLLEVYRGRTILLITHRLHTITEVDHVIWLEKGRVTAQGSPKDLAPLISHSFQDVAAH